MRTSLTLRGGVVMPALGLGVFQSPPQETAAAVESALRAGYRLIDTAAVYGNEQQVGEGLRRSEVPREEVFLETKVWVSDYGTQATRHAWEKAARKLGVDQIDLLLLHTPAPPRFEQTIEAYGALEALLAREKVRAIGVSNFLPHHMEKLLEQIDVVPALNQIELHPGFQQPDVQAIDAQHGIVDQAWSPIGGITFYPGFDNGLANPLHDAGVTAIADAHGKTPAQVLLRWHLQHDRSAIPKSVNPGRIIENFEVWDFDLDASEMATLDQMDTGQRGGPSPDLDRTRHFDTPIPEG